MRRFIILATILTLLFTSALCSAGIALAITSPFRPGDALFPLQHLAERSGALLVPRPTGRAQYDISMAERRTVDLSRLAGSKNAKLALAFLDQDLDRAMDSFRRVPQSDRGVLKNSFLALIEHARAALGIVANSSSSGEKMITSLQAKLETLQSLVENPALAQAAENIQPGGKDLGQARLPAPTGEGTALSPVDPETVIFPPDSPGARHEFFPLLGQHALLECQACHSTGQFAGTQNTCESCHQQVKPAGHFTGDCAVCHNPVAWKDIHFDHLAMGAEHCLSCHSKNKPASHFDGQCSACHGTSAWKPADFNHSAARATDCRACHTKNKPAGHYSGQCSACHSTTAWRPASFNHEAAGATDCQSCHSQRKPANHFNGQCSACHSTNAWKPASFNHKATGATDCQSCHSRQKPANHFSGQCSSCHSTNAWKPANFNHEAYGATDCQSCHSQRKPANHFSGQCSSCHSTNAWKPANFSHDAAGATDCQSCHSRQKPANHFSGQCSSCHSTNAWKPASFNHQAAGATDCVACHAGDRPANHFEGQCSQCHKTSSWEGATFNHSFPINHKGANGVCAKCHPSGTSTWTCYTCHDQRETEKHHEEEGIFNIAARCVTCHPNGQKGDD